MTHKIKNVTVNSLIISIGGLLLGVSANVSGASVYFGEYFNLQSGTFLEGLSVSMTMLATFIGNFFAGKISDTIGRRKALLLAAVLFSFCTLGSALSTSYAFFLISRFIGGFGIGISLLVAPLFIGEIAPDSRRGLLVSFNQMNIGIGYLMAYLSNTLVNSTFDDPQMKWRMMLGIGFIFPLIYFLALLFVPESPEWTSRRTGVAVSPTLSGNQWKRLFSKKMGLVVAIAFSIAFFQMASGINVVLFYAPKIFELAGFVGKESFFQSNLIGITMVLMTFVSMALIDRLGRKPLLTIGSLIMIIGYGIIGAYIDSRPAVTLIALIAVVIGFSISLGPVMWAYLAEIFPTEIKGLGISLAGMLNGIVSFLVTTLFPIEVRLIGTAGTFFTYMAVMIACLICVTTFYPETKGKSLKEIEAKLTGNHDN